ncbi:hypothetical protein QR680_002996 [Steinernema hermaphroditum]|uniref:Methanethiol oxidase n=1 Tax=Steinernema hermaphroditum TaxID=289476 RepID=A0AA39LJ89_9BILA|nr:hypothetical protein QR680_002996 [Steinernema hermaphroditum]
MGVCMTKKATLQVNTINGNESKLNKRESDINMLVNVPVDIKLSQKDIKEQKRVREKFIIVTCPNTKCDLPDKLIVIDIEPQSPLYCSGYRKPMKVVSELALPSCGDEITRTGWVRTAANPEEIQSSCRPYLVVPCLASSRIYVVEFADNMAMKVAKTIDKEQLAHRDLSAPYAVCSNPGRGTPLFVTTMGDKCGHAKGSSIQLDRKNFTLMEAKDDGGLMSDFGGHMTIQPRHNRMFTTEWGHPNMFHKKISSEHNCLNTYGTGINVWNMTPLHFIQRIELGKNAGRMTTCIRMLHNPECNHLFASSTLGSSIFHIHYITSSDIYKADLIHSYPVVHSEDDLVPAWVADIVISMDDHFLFASTWLEGCITQFDISDPFRTTVVSKVRLGGIPRAGASFARAPPIRAGPSFMQLSLDGRRLYFTNSTYRAWDKQFYPEVFKKGGEVYLIRIDFETGEKMEFDTKFKVDLGTLADGPFLGREIRLPNGDCTSDFFL